MSFKTGTFKHKLSRARNLAKRGGLTKAATIKARGRLPKGKEWWGPEANEKEWQATYIAANNPSKKEGTEPPAKKAKESKTVRHAPTVP